MKILNWADEGSFLNLHSEEVLKEINSTWSYEKPKPDEKLNSQTQGIFHKWPLHRSPELLALYPARPEKVQLLECVDCVYSKDHVLWPDLLVPAAVRNAIRSQIQSVDLRTSAYVVGSSLVVRPLMSMAATMGFSKLILVSHDLDFLKNEKSFLERRLIGVSIETVTTSDLTLQPQNAGLLLNTLNLNEWKDSLQDIAYFNFMTAQGIFVDFFEEGSHKILQEEAQRARLIRILPREIEKSWWKEAELRIGLDQSRRTHSPG